MFWEPELLGASISGGLLFWSIHFASLTFGVQGTGGGRAGVVGGVRGLASIVLAAPRSLLAPIPIGPEL